MSSERIVATYLIETPHPVEHAMRLLRGNSPPVPSSSSRGADALLQRHGARLERIEELETVNEPSLPGTYAPGEGALPARRG